MDDEVHKSLAPPAGSTIGSVVRTGLAAIPIVGGSMATAWAEWDTSRRFKRIEQAVNQLGKLVDQLKILPEQLGDAEMQLLEDGLNRISREHQEKKRKLFVRLIVSCWEHPDAPFEERMHFLRALEEFGDIHIRVLIFLREQDGKGFPGYSQIGAAVLDPGLSKVESDSILVPVMERLASGSGFVERGWFLSGGGGHLLTSDRLSPENIAKKCEHHITPLGLRFLAYLEGTTARLHDESHG